MTDNYWAEYEFDLDRGCPITSFIRAKTEWELIKILKQKTLEVGKLKATIYQGQIKIQEVEYSLRGAQ